MKILISLLTTSILALSGPTNSFAQKITAAFGIEYGKYHMVNLRNYQDDLRMNLPVPAKNIDEYPAWWGYNGSLYYSAGRIRFGLHGGFNSTGARTSYQDYSGSILIDHSARVFRIGAGTDFRMSKSAGPWEAWLSMQVERGTGKYRLQSLALLDGQKLTEEDARFLSRHLLLHPGVIIQKNFSNLFLATRAGYMIDSGAFLEYSEDRSAKLLDSHRKPVAMTWSGFRLGISAGLRF